MEEPRSERTLWLLFAAATVIVIISAAICWSFAHPFGIHWDEAEYLNWAAIDLERLYSGKLLRLGGRFLIGSDGIPPAYRILALPFLAPFGFHTTAARLASLAGFAMSSWFTYLATRRVGSELAGAFAVLIFSLSPEVVSASIVFGTDTPVYLATSAMLYYLFVHWSDPSENRGTWVGLGLALGLGFWSKASFIAIAVPVLAFAVIVDFRKRRNFAGVASLCKAGGLAGLIAAPWWLLNIRPAIAYAKYARGFVRNSLGSPSLATWARWLNSVVQCLLGHGVSIVIAAIAIVFLWTTVIKRENVLDGLQKVVVGTCACAAIPIVLAQLSGTNHLLRHISPAVIPLAIVVGLMAEQTGWTRSQTLLTVSSVLFFVQLLMIIYPVVFPNKVPLDLGFVNGGPPWRVMIRFDQWNWEPLHDMSAACGVEIPTISYLGAGRAFDPPHIESPWFQDPALANISASQFPYANWLWRYEDGPLDWQKVMYGADHSDIVVTAPDYVGEVSNKEDLDNQHNAEFALRLSHDPLFQEPVHLTMGRFAPVDVWVFVKSALACPRQKNAQLRITDQRSPLFQSETAMRDF
jgi:4-amino-4-deoxy-L-arabinose transferase-like glycosyltransferase